MGRKEEILNSILDKHNINYDTNYIDDSERAFDAIKEAMEAYARERKKEWYKKLHTKLVKIQTGEINLQEYINEIVNKINS